MGIDGIGGKPPGGLPPGGVGGPGASRPSEASRPFEVHTEKTEGARKSEAPKSSEGVAPAASSPLDRLRAGQLDVRGYLDAKVDEATAHLHGMRAEDLDGIKRMLRDKLANDPALADLVRRATGKSPEPDEEE
jgi:hypothetical protein